MLSSLGVRMKEFPDPLAGWEDLEPELQARRRSSHAEDLFMRYYVRHILAQFIKLKLIMKKLQIPLALMGVLAPRLRTLDGPLVPPSTRAEIFRRTCLHSHL